jgi:Ca2+-binding EF-hand superfamily protein
MREIDTNNNGKIEFEEFTSLMEKISSIEEIQRESLN